MSTQLVKATEIKLVTFEAGYSKTVVRPTSHSFADDRTQIKVRRIDHVAYEFVMPCSEIACIRHSVLVRLAKELEAV